jgi:hypothetical protein
MKLRMALRNRQSIFSTPSLWAATLLLTACAPDGDGIGSGAGGVAGTAGASGTTGTAGTTGSAGTSGNAGAIGAAGTTGAAGSTGGSGGASAGRGGTGGGATAGTAGSSAGGGATGAGGGTCAAGTSAAFPSVSDYTARDGGFGPVAATRNTGDTTLGTDRVAVFRPAAAKYGQGGVRHPIIVWGNGYTNTVDIWQGFLGRLATYGFVVVAPEQTQVSAAHMNAAIDYVLRLANDPAGSDCGKIDTTKIGATGYSLGGAGAISVGSNARITSTFFFASNGNVRNLKAPWGVIGGDMDTTFNWTAISSAVTGSTQPAFGAALAGIDHNRVAGQAKAQEGLIGWMRWRFMGDQAGHDLFVGATCKICSDAAFSGVVKTASLDSL